MKRNLKKITSLALSLMLAVGLSACGGDSADAPDTTTPPAQTPTVETSPDDGADGVGTQQAGSLTVEGPVELTFATQDVGTTAYVYASTMANMFTDVFPDGSVIDVTTTSPGGVGAPVVLENGQCDVIISNGAPSKWAYETGILDSFPTRNVRSIAGGLDKAFINVLFTQEFVDKTGITSVEEVVAQQYPIRIAIKSPGAFGELACAKVLEVLGVSYDDINAWGGSVTNTGTDGIISLLKDGKADMTIDHLAAGQSATTELCMTTNMYFPQLSDDTLAKLEEEGFAPETIEPGTWKGQDALIHSVGSPQVILIHADVDDATAYLITKTICEGRDTLVNASQALAVFDPQTAWEPLNVGAPLHPGAEAYYKEMGYME